jgi:hypothetical protein
MYGGEIKDNHASLGGGVYVTQGTDSTGTHRGIFIMAGGTVYGNSAGSGLANTASYNGAALYSPFGYAYWGDGATAIPNKSNRTEPSTAVLPREP